MRGGVLQYHKNTNNSNITMTATTPKKLQQHLKLQCHCQQHLPRTTKATTTVTSSDFIILFNINFFETRVMRYDDDDVDGGDDSRCVCEGELKGVKRSRI